MLNLAEYRQRPALLAERLICAGRESLVRLVRAQSARFVPEKMGRSAA